MRMEQRAQEAVTFSEWLDAIPPGRAVCAFARDVDELFEELERVVSLAEPRATVVRLEWQELPQLVDEMTSVPRALGQAVLSLWPELYASAQVRAGTDRTDSEALAQQVRGATPGAVRRILRACRAGEVPILERFPLAEQVEQLVLATDPERALIVLVGRSPSATRDRVLAFARGAEWIASCSHARVVALLRAELAELRELDSIAYGAFTWTSGAGAPQGIAAVHPFHDAVAVSGVVVAPVDESEPRVTVSPILGRPHPSSAAEKILYERVTADAELAPLFSYNQLVKTRFGNTPRVDLLWQRGQLVVEIDGPDHQKQSKFYADRHRDYELMLSGYHVLRVVDAEVLLDPLRVLEKLRSAVRFLVKEG